MSPQVTGGITIEGEGNNTIITNTTAAPIFVVKSNYNTIKNMRIAINDGVPTTGIQLTQDYANARKVENNIFENLYIGHWNLENTPRTNATFVGIELLQTQYSNIGYNKFKNISLQSLYTGIKFSTDGETQSRDHDNNPITPAIVSLINNINDNVFDNINMKDINTGIDFVPNPTTNPTFYPQADYNSFNSIHIQTAANTVCFVKNVSGSMNYFNDCKAADWVSTSARKIFTITSSAVQTTISNCRMATGEVHANSNDLVDGGFNTQLINNYHFSGKMINKIGLDRDPTNTSRSLDKSITEIKGVLKLSASSGPSASQTANPTFGDGKVLTSDANGFATWQTLGSLAWDYNTNKNIKMNGFALTNNSNATPATNNAPGLRLDNLGNVRIGTVAPFTTNPAKLQVDGRTIIGTANDEINALDSTYKLIVNGKVRVKNEVFIKSAGLTWPDYVFNKTYNLMPLSELENYIQKEKHLPNMPSAAVIEKDGVPLSEMIIKQQEKIEELTLYVIAMQKEIARLKNEPKK